MGQLLPWKPHASDEMCEGAIWADAESRFNQAAGFLKSLSKDSRPFSPSDDEVSGATLAVPAPPLDNNRHAQGNSFKGRFISPFRTQSGLAFTVRDAYETATPDATMHPDWSKDRGGCASSTHLVVINQPLV